MGELLAITAEQATRLTGLSRDQLKYWDETRFFSPANVVASGRYFSRLYSFRDVVGLRVIARLREKVSLQTLRKIAAWLKERHQEPWSQLRFFIDAKHRVHFRDPETGLVLQAADGEQAAIEIAMEEVAADVRSAAQGMQSRGVEQVGRIERHRYVMHNAHVMAGTRIPTAAVWRLSDAGYSVDQILYEYPRLTAADVQAALEHEGARRKRRRAS
jgi:uncharacterized protein (DUF433 family)